MMTRFRQPLLMIFASTLTAFVAQFACAQQPNIPYQKVVLRNGMTLIVHEDNKAPIVAVNLWYHVGSKNEEPGKTGFAHLFEHLMFGGSLHSEGNYLKALESIGATGINGTTNPDRTNFSENVPTSALDRTLWMEADRMAYLDLSQKTLDLQRGVVENEKREHENHPYYRTEEYFPENTYPAAHPYSWETIGHMADLSAASLKDVQQWYHSYYSPSNAVLVLAGNIDVQTAKEKVEKYFGDIPPGPPVAHQKIWIAKMAGTHRQITQDRVPLARVYEIWNVPQFASADSDYLTLVSSCLGEGKSSRLYKRLVYDDEIASDVVVYNNARETGGQFVIHATVSTGHSLSEVERALNEEMARFLKIGPTPTELQRVKTSYLATFVRGIQRIGGAGGSSDVLARYATFTGDPGGYEASVTRVRHATAEELRSAAGRWFSDGVFITEVMPFPDYKIAAAQVEHNKAPALGAPPELRLPKLERTTFSNGLKVILAERPGAGLVNMWMEFNAGSAADALALPGTAKLTAATLIDGTRTRSALEISSEVALLGAQLRGSADSDSSNIRLSALKENLNPSLDLFSDVILNPSFPPVGFKREQKLQLDAIEQEQNQPFGMVLRVLPRLLYGSGHPYANPYSGSGTASSVKKITRDDIVKFHDTWFRPNNATLIVVGDTTLAEIRPKLEKAFASWKPGPVPSIDMPIVQLPSEPAVYIIDKPNATQSIIFAGNLMPPPAAETQAAINAMNEVLGGTFGSRLNMDLRENKHWSYGAGSEILDVSGQRPFVAVAPVQTDRTEQSVAELNQQIRAFLSNQPVTPQELAHIQTDETLSLPGSLETLDDVGNSLLRMIEFHWPDNYYDTMADRIRALGSSDLDAAARAVIHPDNFIWVIVGDLAKIEPGVRKLDLGQIHIIDADGNLTRNLSTSAGQIQ